VRSWKAIVTVTLLAVWAGCALHCALESITSSPSLDCCNEEAERSSDSNPDSPGQCVCSTIQSALYSTQQSGFSVPLPIVGVFLFDLPVRDEAESLSLPGLFRASASPPDNQCRWQFVVRAAMPVRAPSLLS